LEVDYVGRLAHRLSALADAGQLFDFTDPASKTTLVNSMTNLEIAARANTDPAAVTTQPFFENQMQAATGASCADINAAFGSPFSTCTQFVYAANQLALQQGNLFNAVKVLLQGDLLPQNVGISPQFVSNYYYSNKGWSNYNSLIAILRKRLS